MNKFISEVFPDWGDGATQLQLTARKDKQFVDVEFVTTQTELTQVINAWKKYDIYYTIVVFSKIAKGKKNRAKRLPHTIAHRRRHVILDFDFKDQIDKFRTVRPLYGAVANRLGKPHMVINSGNGIHIYYRVKTKQPDKILELQRRAMSAFRSQSSDLPIVDARACKTERDLIRLPGSTNQKSGTQVAHRIIDSKGFILASKLPKDAPNVFKGLDLVPPADGNPYLKGFSPTTDSEPAYYEDLLDVCAAARLFVRDSTSSFTRDGKVRGNHEDVINWSAIVNFTESHKTPLVKHRANLIDIMAEFPQSSRDWLENQVSSVRFPRGCSRWSDDYRPACKGCSYFENYTGQGVPTPIGAAKQHRITQRDKKVVKRVQATDPDEETHLCPMGQYIFLDGSLFKYRGDNKSSLMVSAKPFRLFKGQATVPDRGSYVMVRCYNRYGYDDRLTKIRGTDAAQLESLANIGIVQTNKESKSHVPKDELLLYFRQQLTHTIPVQYYLGWNKHRNSFAFPETTYNKDKAGLVHFDCPPVITSQVDRFKTRKDANCDQWWEGARELFFSIPEMAIYAKMVLAAFASVLYYFLPIETGVRGHTMVLVGPPGCGKTVALNAASSVWGCSGYTNTKSDTFPSLINSLGANPFLPITFDDIMRSGASLKDDDIAQLSHTVTEGRSRARSRSDGGGNLTTQEFSTMLLATSNESMRKMVAKQQNRMDAASAGMDRITEHYCREQKALIMANQGIDIVKLSNAIEPLLQLNGGVAGREFMRYIMPRRKELIGMMQFNYQQMHNDIGNKRHEAKFLASLLTAKQILNKMGRLTGAPDSVVFGKADVADYLEETNRVKQVAFTDALPSVDEFSMYFLSCATDVFMTYAKGKYNMDITPPMNYNQSLWTGLPMWHFGPNNTIKSFRNVFPGRSVFVMGYEPNLMSLALRKMNCNKPAKEVVKSWVKTEQARRYYTAKMYFKWRTVGSGVFDGTVIAWPIS